MIVCKCPFFLDEKRNVFYCEAIDRNLIKKRVDGMLADEMRFKNHLDKKEHQLKHCIQLEPFSCHRYNELMKKYNK